MYLSRIDLPEDQRAPVIALLQARLSDTLDMAAQLKQAHWNVKGMAFHQLHTLFDAIFVDTEAHVDLLAERLVTLGGVADGRIQATARFSSLADYPLDATSGEQHLRAIGGALARLAGCLRADIDGATALGDAGTANLFTEVSRAVDKSLWLVEAHLQAEVRLKD
jgi:starvation-inducible DNA-binding protein